MRLQSQPTPCNLSILSHFLESCYTPPIKRIRIHPGQSVGLPLSDTERKVNCDSFVIPDKYIVRIRNADPEKQEVPFTLDDLDDFSGYVAAEANHCKNKKRKRILDGVSDSINDLLGRYTDEDTEQDDDDDNTQSEDSDPVERLLDFANQMEQVCETAGLDFEEVLQGMEPTRIRADGGMTGVGYHADIHRQCATGVHTACLCSC